MELTDIKPSEITFTEKLFTSEFSAIFLVVIRGQTCVMKVHHGRGPRRYYEPKDRELDIHILERDAYQRLKEYGLCDRGIVPQFYGSMEKFDPSPCQPHLRMFIEDEYPPSAILIEYIPNSEMIHLHNYTTKRVDRLIEGIKEIHKALILHRDPRPRNMLLVKDDPDPDRVIWIDFDRAHTFHEDQITEKQKTDLTKEEESVTRFRNKMKEDVEKGKLEKAYLYY